MINSGYLTGQRQHLQQDEQSASVAYGIRISTLRARHAERHITPYGMVDGGCGGLAGSLGVRLL